MSGAIAVFVKTPAAEAFHLASSQSVSSVAQSLSQQADIKSYYAVAEEAALNHSHWDALPCVWQGEGGLGERMAHIYQTLLSEHDFVILVGADIPQMTSAELLSASAWLTHEEQARFVFGPSVDGGFWVFGGNCSIPQSLWTDVVYSVADTGAQFFNKIEHLGAIKTLSPLRDVDEVSDLLPLRDALLNLTEPLPEQYELIRFLDVLYFARPRLRISNS